MFSKIAKIDIDNLRQSGFNPTDEQIIKLNDIAVKIETNSNANIAHSPRISKCGNVILHEPSVGALQWWFSYGKDAYGDVDMQLMTQYYMLAHGDNPDKLFYTVTDKDIRKSVKDWAKTITATQTQLFYGMMYVKRIDDIDINDTSDDCDDSDMSDRLEYMIMSTGVTCGVDPDALKTKTQTQLVAMLTKASYLQGKPIKPSIAKYYMEYKKILKEIETTNNKD